jgi:hypothetical protein
MMIAILGAYKALRVVMKNCGLLWELKVANRRLFSSYDLEVVPTTTFNLRAPL